MSAAEIRLRAVESTDLAVTRSWRNDPSVSVPIIGRPFPITERNELAWYESLGVGALPAAAVWAIDAGDGIVGVVQINEIDWLHRTAWFGIFVGPEHQGRGYGRAGTVLACDHAFQRFNLRQVRLRVRADNAAAVGLYADLGFEHEGTLVGAVLDGDIAVDVHVMRRSRPSSPPPAPSDRPTS